MIRSICIRRVLLVLFGLTVSALAGADWQISVNKEMQKDEAVRLALQDLKTTAAGYGIDFEITDDQQPVKDQAILVGGPDRNRQVANLADRQAYHVEVPADTQGYQIRTIIDSGKKVMLVSGGSVIGDVYGLYWIWDRIRVNKTLPEINVTRIPALKTRMSLAWGRSPFGGGSEADMHQALRYSGNWVSGKAILDLVPWNSEPEKSLNKQNREETRKLIAYAHSLHIKYFCFANEFTYHPTLLAENNARLSPCDENFWNALQDKYRRLFQAMPELDGIEVCTDDISGFWDDYRPFDLMHQGEGCEWPLDKRYRVFVKKLWDVVVGEFDKTYFHFTWSLVTHEQHYSANVFRQIFTEDIPEKNLFLIPKITSGDRNWHQPYNPTFNQSKHSTLVAFETMNYYEGSSSNIFPTFSAAYYQGGLQTFLTPKNSNIRGAGFLVAKPRAEWDTYAAYAYVLYRLSWNPDEDIRQIAEDFCAINFGRAAAAQMAEIYLATPTAYKYGLYIEPVAYGQFNSFPHMRVNTFPAMGYPSIDDGREHIEFLRGIYLRCKPWLFETLDDLDHGLAVAEKMGLDFQSVKPRIEDRNLAVELENRLAMTGQLIRTNNRYIKTAFAYFAYQEKADEDTKQQLSSAYDDLVKSREAFINTPGFGYKLFGVDQLITNARQMLDDRDEAEKILSLAPSREELETTINRQQTIYNELLEKYKDQAVLVAAVEIKIDGRDILVIKGDTHTIEHLRWDPAHIQKLKFINPLPEGEVTVLPKDIESRPMHPFILEQPTAENGYAAKVYLYDKPGGDGIMKFDLYYIDKTPMELGLDLPWRNPR